MFQQGQKFTRFNFGTILEVREETLIIQIEGQTSEICKKLAAQQFDIIQTNTLTKVSGIRALQDKITQNPRTVMQVSWRKKMKISDVKGAFVDGDLEAVVYAALGEVRTADGYYNGNTSPEGRYHFITSDGMKLVDPRTLELVTVNGIQYTI